MTSGGYGATTTLPTPHPGAARTSSTSTVRAPTPRSTVRNTATGRCGRLDCARLSSVKEYRRLGDRPGRMGYDTGPNDPYEPEAEAEKAHGHGSESAVLAIATR